METKQATAGLLEVPLHEKEQKATSVSCKRYTVSLQYNF